MIFFVRVNVLSILATVFCLLSPARSQDTSSPLGLRETIALPAIHGEFNHMSVDAERERLFVPAPADRILEIVDLRSGKAWRSLPAARPTTALYAREFNQLYLTTGPNLDIYDGTTLDRIVSINLRGRLDQLQYDPVAKELYVGCMMEGKTGIAIVSIPDGKLVGEIRLPGSPQGFAVEKEGPRIFVNVPDNSFIAVINRRERKVVAKWNLEPAGDNFPIALDEKGHRVFVACRTPAEMLALDSQSGRIVVRVASVRDADDMWYDETERRIYITGGEGFVSVIQQQDASRYSLLGRVATAPQAANSVFSSQMRSLYVSVPLRGKQAAEILAFTTR